MFSLLLPTRDQYLIYVTHAMKFGIIRLILFVAFILYQVKAEVNTLEELVRHVREKVWWDLRNIRESFKAQRRERDKMEKRIGIACDTDKYFENLKTRMRTLEDEFSTLMNTLESIPIFETQEQDQDSENYEYLSGSEVNDYKEALKVIRSLHSAFDAIETEIWEEKFRRQILNRKLKRMQKKIKGEAVNKLKAKVAVWGLDGSADLIIAESPVTEDFTFETPVPLKLVKIKSKNISQNTFATPIRSFEGCLPFEDSSTCKKYFMDFAGLSPDQFVAVDDVANAIMIYDIEGYMVGNFTFPVKDGKVEGLAAVSVTQIVVAFPVAKKIILLDLYPKPNINKQVLLDYNCGWDIVVTRNLFLLGCEFPSAIRVYSREWQYLYAVDSQAEVDLSIVPMRRVSTPSIHQREFPDQTNVTEAEEISEDSTQKSGDHLSDQTTETLITSASSVTVTTTPTVTTTESTYTTTVSATTIANKSTSTTSARTITATEIRKGRHPKRPKNEERKRKKNWKQTEKRKRRKKKKKGFLAEEAWNISSVSSTNVFESGTTVSKISYTTDTTQATHTIISKPSSRTSKKLTQTTTISKPSAMTTIPKLALTTTTSKPTMTTDSKTITSATTKLPSSNTASSSAATTTTLVNGTVTPKLIPTRNATFSEYIQDQFQSITVNKSKKKMTHLKPAEITSEKSTQTINSEELTQSTTIQESAQRAVAQESIQRTTAQEITQIRTTQKPTVITDKEQIQTTTLKAPPSKLTTTESAGVTSQASHNESTAQHSSRVSSTASSMSTKPTSVTESTTTTTSGPSKREGIKIVSVSVTKTPTLPNTKHTTREEPKLTSPNTLFPKITISVFTKQSSTHSKSTAVKSTSTKHFSPETTSTTTSTTTTSEAPDTITPSTSASSILPSTASSTTLPTTTSSTTLPTTALSTVLPTTTSSATLSTATSSTLPTTMSSTTLLTTTSSTRIPTTISSTIPPTSSTTVQTTSQINLLATTSTTSSSSKIKVTLIPSAAGKTYTLTETPNTPAVTTSATSSDISNLSTSVQTSTPTTIRETSPSTVTTTPHFSSPKTTYSELPLTTDETKTASSLTVTAALTSISTSTTDVTSTRQTSSTKSSDKADDERSRVETKKRKRKERKERKRLTKEQRKYKKSSRQSTKKKNTKKYSKSDDAKTKRRKTRKGKKKHKTKVAAEREVSITKRNVPIIKQDHPETKRDIPIMQRGIPNAKLDFPVIKQDILKTSQNVPKTKLDIPEIHQDVPITKRKVITPRIKRAAVFDQIPKEYLTKTIAVENTTETSERADNNTDRTVLAEERYGNWSFQNHVPNTARIRIFSRPHWIAWDDLRQILVYCDTKDGIIGGVYLDGRVHFLQYPRHDTYWWPHDITIDDRGTIYITDVGNNRVAVMTSSGRVKGYIEDLNTPIALTFLPQTKLLAVGSQDGTITILKLLHNE